MNTEIKYYQVENLLNDLGIDLVINDHTIVVVDIETKE